VTVIPLLHETVRFPDESDVVEHDTPSEWGLPLLMSSGTFPELLQLIEAVPIRRRITLKLCLNGARCIE
jgi:hypothetical protein